MSIELENEYVTGLDLPSTINCTSIMNPNTTKVFLVAIKSKNVIVFPTNHETTFVKPANEDGCNPNVRVVYQAENLDWEDIDSLACMVEDKDYGKNFTSEFKDPYIINNA